MTNEELYEIDPEIAKKNAELTWWLELDKEKTNEQRQTVRSKE